MTLTEFWKTISHSCTETFIDLSDFEDAAAETDVATETDVDVDSVVASDDDFEMLHEDEKTFVIDASSRQEVAVSGMVEAVVLGVSEGEKTVVIEASSIQDGYKVCSVCENNIRKIRFADRGTI